ncbi:MAG TPA: heparinase II/III family protein [Actinopolymorphaceae bacterium]
MRRLLELIPEKVGFRFCGLPDQPHLRPQDLFQWSPDNPDVMTSAYTDLTYPNDEYPEDRVMRVQNRKGETVEYPYHEDGDGKRYFISGHLWYLQKDYMLRALEGVARDDPLGAARLLYRWAQVYEGYVPTNEYPWHNQPVDPASGPPYYWWGGTWSRWSVSDLGSLRYVSEAYAIVDETTAFEELSKEVGEDVRKKIRKDVFEPSVYYVRSFVTLYHNMEYHNARGLISVGKALGDPSYVHEAVEWAVRYAEGTYLFDGFFKENSLSYHNQSTNGLIVVIEDVAGWTDPEGYLSPRSGDRFDDLDLAKRTPVLGSAAEIPRLLAYPDGKYLPTQDTWANAVSGRPDWSVGSFVLPASGIARLSRGNPGDPGDDKGIDYQFPEMEIVEQSVDHRNFPDSGTLQLEASEPGHHITFAFEVEKAASYEVELRPFVAGTYGIYRVEIDGEQVAEIDFFGPGGPSDYRALTRLSLTAGRHEITFRNNGKNESSTNYKMGVITLRLLSGEEKQARVRAVQQAGNPAQLYLTFTPKYGHHHNDALNLMLFAEGQELLPDVGYTHTKYRWWTRSTLGHNTVVVDADDIAVDGDAEDGGSLELFAPLDNGVQVMRASHDSGYAQTSVYCREPWFIGFPEAANNEGYVLDLFRVAGGERHEYTFQGDANRDATFETDLPLETYGPYLLPEGVEVVEPERETEKGSAEGHYYGYIYVRDVQRAPVADGRWEVTLATEDEGVALARAKIIGLVEPGDNEIFLGRSPSMRATRLYGTSKDNNNEAVKYFMPKLVVRRSGSDLASSFVTAFEPYASGGTPRISQVERLTPESGGSGALAVRIEHAGGTDIVLSSLDAETPLVVDDLRLEGKAGFVRLKDGQVQAMRLVGGTLLRKGDVTLTGDGPVTGVVSSVRRVGAGDDADAFVTEATVPDWVVGHTIVVRHPDGKTHGYPIASVDVADGRTVIGVDRFDPGFVVDADGGSRMLFHPFTRWTGETTFHIDNVADHGAPDHK